MRKFRQAVRHVHSLIRIEDSRFVISHRLRFAGNHLSKRHDCLGEMPSEKRYVLGFNKKRVRRAWELGVRVAETLGCMELLGLYQDTLGQRTSLMINVQLK